MAFHISSTRGHNSPSYYNMSADALSDYKTGLVNVLKGTLVIIDNPIPAKSLT